jgi:hypothetical protein
MNKFIALLALIFPLTAYAQPTFTANNFVPEFKGNFGYGTNLGISPPYYMDKELAALVHGTPDGSIPGVGITTIRPGLFEYFLDYWGTDIRIDAFRYYQEIGIKDVCVIIGHPGENNRDQANYCPGSPSEAFKGMYEPIWDNGENGTPVNDNNKYALYVWKTVNAYKDYVTFWEVYNEPDIDLSGNAWAPPGYPGNWWDNAPQPCETKMKAPIYFYVRLLRISYEVIKTVAPEDYVAVGGLGNASYLDAIMRHTDNPFDGTVNGEYPLLGGAYFDCMSFHSYPHIDNSMRWWDNSIGGFAYNRQSDGAVDGLWRLKHKFEDVLTSYGYNGTNHPKKTWICTEFNIPRKEYQDYIGSEAAQVNFMIKALVTAQQEGMAQMHTYCLADEKKESQADNEFAFMGLFKNLNDVQPPHAEANSLAWAMKTTSDQLRDKKYDRVRTEQLQLPSNVRGAAFKDPSNGKFTYVLWAVTTKDKDENAEADYAFPATLNVKNLDQKFWHYSQTGTHITANANQLKLTGSPVFLTETGALPKKPKQPVVAPNPNRGGIGVYSFYMFEDAPATIQIYDAQSHLVETLAEEEEFIEGPHEIPFDLSKNPAGMYYVRIATPESNITVPLVKF